MPDLVTPEPAPFGAYVLTCARQYQRPGTKRPEVDPEPAPAVGLLLHQVGHPAPADLTPEECARVLPDVDLTAAVEQWREARGWTHHFVRGCACVSMESHLDWAAVARCLQPGARVIDLVRYGSSPEVRVAEWARGTSVLVTAARSLAENDGQLTPGVGALRRVRVLHATGVEVPDPLL